MEKVKSIMIMGQFEGEYINGLRWNGKGYNHEGKEEFEIKNGNGFGKEFYSNGSIKYEGV